MKKWSGVFWKVCVSLEANLEIGYGLSGSSFPQLISALSTHFAYGFISPQMRSALTTHFVYGFISAKARGLTY